MRREQVRQTWWDIQAAAERLAVIWDVELVQSSAGLLRLDFCHVSLGGCAVYECRTNVELVASGARSDHYVTISPISSDCAGSRFRGKEIEPKHLLLMDPGGEVFQQFAAEHRQLAVSIPAHLFRRVAAAEFIPEDRVDDFIAWQSLVPNGDKLKPLRRTLAGILRGELRPPRRLEGSKARSGRLADGEYSGRPF